MAKEFLTEHKISFEEYDVMKDREKAKELVEKRRAVRKEEDREIFFPVIDVNGTLVQGFQEEELRKALALDK